MRRLGQLLLLALLVVVAGFYPLLAPTPHRIDQAHFDLIGEGMTPSDVEAIFGVPEGVYDGAWVLEKRHDLGLVIAVQSDPRSVIPVATGVNPQVRSWIGRHGMYVIMVNEQNRVIGAYEAGSPVIKPPWQRWWKAIWER
jgi:hypothetical protein